MEMTLTMSDDIRDMIAEFCADPNSDVSGIGGLVHQAALGSSPEDLPDVVLGTLNGLIDSAQAMKRRVAIVDLLTQLDTGK